MKPIIIIFMSMLLLSACFTKSKEAKVLALRQGFILTSDHAETYYAVMEELNGAAPDIIEKAGFKKLLVAEFNEDPEETLEFLMTYTAETQNNVSTPDIRANLQKDIPMNKVNNQDNETPQKQSDLADGFIQFRKTMDYSDHSVFETSLANELREIFKNSLLRHENVETYGSGGFVGNSTYIEVMQFCGDGTFVFQSNSGVSASSSGYGGIDQDGSTFAGVWETFTENGNAFLALYSQDPWILEVNPKGFLPMLLKSVSADVVRIANNPKDKLYRKSGINCSDS